MLSRQPAQLLVGRAFCRVIARLLTECLPHVTRCDDQRAAVPRWCPAKLRPFPAGSAQSLNRSLRDVL